ncbi:GDSL-type esterase/lipase family protein [Amycolatopsis sp. cmx-4-61]|uniref:GDSL-type esterase/lipase family protein n=1 Tax=Amycolatopsis sp. cmx-4-61 TaxID=2790937 RepID=UPI00397E32AE
MKAVLCFGDSNTNGARADEPQLGRLPAELRWPGRLRKLLGPRFEVLEEGLGGRTTDLDPPDLPGRNGRAYFGPCLLSHHPLAVVVLMLGTPDLKTRFARTPAQIAGALDGYFDDVERFLGGRSRPQPRVIVVSPAHLGAVPTSAEYDAGSVRKSRELAGELRAVAAGRGAGFLDAAAFARVGGDGVHLDLASHDALAARLAPMVLDIGEP